MPHDLVPCNHHPTFDGSRRPNSACLHCWALWCEAHPQEAVTGYEMQRILALILSRISVLESRMRWKADK